MEYHYVLNRPWISAGNDGLLEDYACFITDNEMKDKYNILERISGAIGLNHEVSEEKNKIYGKIIRTFYDTISSFDGVDVSLYEYEADSIDIKARNKDRAHKKLKNFNKELDHNISDILHKSNYHLNLNGHFLGED